MPNLWGQSKPMKKAIALILALTVFAVAIYFSINHKPQTPQTPETLTQPINVSNTPTPAPAPAPKPAEPTEPKEPKETPSVPPADQVAKYKIELKTRGIRFNAFPDRLVGQVYTALSVFPEVKNVTFGYEPSQFTCGGAKFNNGCFDFGPTYRIIRVSDRFAEVFFTTVPKGFNRKYAFQFVVLHEATHSTGVRDEKMADDSALAHLKLLYNDVIK